MGTNRLRLVIGGVAIAVTLAFLYRQVLPLSPSRVGGAAPMALTAADAPSPANGEAKRPGRSGPPPAPVTAAIATEADMPIVLSAPGIVEPLATIAVKPRVDGQIVEVGFQEGDLVKEGQILFRLDDRMVLAQIRQAEANIAKDQASLKIGMAVLFRRETLAKQKITSEEAVETAKDRVEGLKANIAAGQAQLEAQRTQLDYLTIRAPITGRTGSINAKLGATVRANDATALVTINQTQPITVGFAVPQSELGALRRALLARSPAEVTIAGRQAVKLPGTISMVDNHVDRQTGTIMAKVTVANADEALWPGQAVDVALTVEVKPRVLSVPASAVLPAQQGMIVWVIGQDNKVATREVSVERIVGQTAFLAAGIKPGERVVTDGQLRLAPGAAVSIQEPRRAPATGPTVSRPANGRS
jgi:multidrug efflux system membrane fusion protein